jgi:tetratricopeptide (TPR) repeat protein
LSVFAGGWTLEAAEAVCSGDGLEQVDILNLSTHLVDKSLVVMDESSQVLRFHMLETIREYALEKLDASVEAQDLRLKHASHFLNLVNEVREHLHTLDQTVWINSLERERDNLREALRWSAVQEQSAIFLQLTGNSWQYWIVRGPVTEGRAWLEQAVKVCESDRSDLDSEIVKNILSGASELARFQGDFERALVLKQKNLEMCRQLGKEKTVAAILNDLATIYAIQGDCENSLASAQEAVALRRKFGNPWGVAHALTGLCYAWMCLDNPQAAREAIEEATQIDRDDQNPDGLLDDLITLMFIAVRQAHYEEAYVIFEEIVPAAQALAFQEPIAIGIYGRGILEGAQGRARQAARLLGIAEQMASLGGFRLQFPGRVWVEHTIQGAKSNLSEGLWDQEYQAGQVFAINNSPTMEQAFAFAAENIHE